MPTSGGMLGEIQDNLLQEALGKLGPEWQTQPLPAQIEEAKRRLLMVNKIDDTANFAVKKHQEAVADFQDMQHDLPGSVTSSKRIFDLKKISQFMPPDMGSAPQMPQQSAPNVEMPKFTDAAQLRDYLANTDFDTAASQFADLVSINPELEQSVDDAIGRFYESNDPQRQLEMASVIYNSLPQSSRNSADDVGGDTQVTGIEQTVKASNEAIRLAAIKLANQNKSKPVVAFNMKRLKTAQHKGMENVMMFGPDQVRVDPFTGQLISKWHVYERNKGYGIRINDALDVDFEAIWRGNVMDKYSRPYRNEDGEYVGGYINKRFEVDRMVPEANSYQMKPGEKRRPYLPEYRSTEARLQNMRSEAKDGDHMPEYANTEKATDWAKDGTKFAPFNWKKANEKKASSEVKKKVV